MATAPKPAPKKKGLMGLSPIAWGGILLGAVATFYLYRRSQASSAANAANTAAATPTTTSGGTSSTTAPSFSNFAQWEQSALASITGLNYSNTAALNDISAWINGSCVSQAGFTAIGNFIAAGGAPPGFGSALPALSVCPSPTAPAAAATTTPTQLVQSMIPAPVAPTPASLPTPGPTSTPTPTNNPYGPGGIFGTLIDGSAIGQAAGGLYNYISTPAYASQLSNSGVTIVQNNGHEYWKVN